MSDSLSDNSTPRDTVSVIIPTYNSADVLVDALSSVLEQTRPADEIIVVDDGSSDDTESVCRQFGDAITYIRQSNAGASTARNTGAAAASGCWLAFLDADDVWDPEKLEIQMAALERHPEAHFTIAAANVWSARESVYYKYEWTGSLDPRKLRSALLVRNIFTGLCSTLVVRRDAFDAVGGFADGKLSEDRRIALDLLAEHRGLILQDALVSQRAGPASFGDPEIMRRAMLELINDYLPLFAHLDTSGRLLRRSRARVYERAGMHYLEQGELASAAKDLAQAAYLWPFMANPWRFLANACLGRLKRYRQVDGKSDDDANAGAATQAA